MTPQAILIYEIDKSFGPNILAEHVLNQVKLPTYLLKDLVEEHVQKNQETVTLQKDNKRIYSTKFDSNLINKDNVYLGVLLREDDDLISIKSMAETLKSKMTQNFTEDKKKLEKLLKSSYDSILTLMEKLKEPALIVETINEKTKRMIDEGKLQEARELIDLGEEIPAKLASEIKLAEQFLEEKLYKKAKKSFQKAAELAELIQEDEIVIFLQHKAEEIGTFPDLIKEKDQLFKNLQDILKDLEENNLYLYKELANPINRLIEIISSFGDNQLINKLTELNAVVNRASKIAKELYDIDKKIRNMFSKLY